jgi:hypothetical protein
MIDDGVVVKVEATAERQGTPGNDILALGVTVYKSDGSKETYLFDILWRNT